METPLILRAVIENWDEIAVVNLLRTGTDVNKRNRLTDRTALFEAAAGNRLAMVNLLVDWKANVNLRCRGETALHVAARLGHIEVVEALLKSNIDPRIKNNFGQTALHVAVRFGRSQVAKLLALNVDETAHLVILAVKMTTEDVVLALVERCAECELEQYDRKTGLLPLHLAVLKKYYRAVEMISKRVGEHVNRMSMGHLDALYLATDNRDLKMVKLLVKYGAKMKVTSQGLPLHLAATIGSYEILEYFLERGHGSTDLADLDGSTILHAAVRSDSLPVVNLCLRYGADPRARSLYNKKRTVLAYAVSLGHHKMVKLLLDLGCPVDEGRQKCCTLLSDAISKEKEDIIELLLERGANLSATRNDFCDDRIDMTMRALVTVAERFGSSKPQHIIDNIEAVHSRGSRWSRSYLNCTKEFKNLANEVIYQKFTLRDSLVGGMKTLARFARNTYFIEGFFSLLDKLDTCFPIFSARLKHNYEKALQRRAHVNETEAALKVALPFLPTTCADIVMRNLEDEDLINFSSAVFNM